MDFFERGRVLSFSFIFFIILTLQGQPFKNLVFEDGGMRGVSYAGALSELEKFGFLNDIECVAGTSVGAITALTLSLGYTPQEITGLIGNTNPRKFNDGTFLMFGGGTRLRKHYGWYKGNNFIRWTERIIEKKTQHKDITFQELHDRKYLDLYVTGTSLNNQKVIVFSYKTYPNMRVKDAIRISMSTPFFFKAIFIDSIGNVLRKRNSKSNFDIMVDGGFISNYPIDIFDKIDSLNKRIPNPYTLGFRMDSNNQLVYDKMRKGLAPVNVRSLKNFVGAFFNFIMESMNRSSLSEEDWDRTISIGADLVGPKIKKYKPEELMELTESGRKAVHEFFEKKKSAK